jgi:HD-GYP domain-containing protein (c-di-GMP phosphodiesterase class II)
MREYVRGHFLGVRGKRRRKEFKQYQRGTIVSQLILLQDNLKKDQLQKAIIEKELDLNVISKDSIEEVFHLLKLIPNTEIILVPTIVQGKKIPNEIVLQISEEFKKLKIIILGDWTLPEHKKHNITVIPKGYKIQDILSCLSNILDKNIEIRETYAYDDELISVDAKLIQKIKIAPCDLYIKIKKGDEEKFILRFRGNEEIDISRLNNYIEAGESCLFVTQQNYEILKNFLNNKILKSLERNVMTTENRSSITKRSYKYLVDELHAEGFSDRTSELVDGVISSIERISSATNTAPRLAKHLKYILSLKDSKCYIHCELLAIVSSSMVQNSEWGSKQQCEKLAFVSMFHDFKILDRDDFMNISNAEDLKKALLTEEDRILLEQHALEASLFVQDLPGLPLGVETIILQHHGIKSGIGFPEEMITTSLSPLSIIFIIAEEFVHEFINKEKSGLKISEILVKVEEKYSKASFSKALASLRKSFTKTNYR